jgi:hypothetical protein
MNPASQNQTTTTQSPPWQQPYQNYGLNQAYSLYQQGPTVSPFSPMQEQALGGIQNLAGNNPVTQGAANYNTSVLNGGFMGANPYLNAQFNQAADQTQNRLASEFAGSGRNVSGAQPLRSDELNNLATNIYGGAYNTGINQMEQAANNAPNVQGMQYQDLSQLFGGGAQVQNLAQRYADAPSNWLNQYFGRVTPNMGSVQTSPQYYNQGAGALGGALTGLGIGKDLGLSPWLGALGGAILGG